MAGVDAETSNSGAMPEMVKICHPTGKSTFPPNRMATERHNVLAER